MEKLRNDKNLPEQTEEFSNLDDWWLDEEDSADSLPVFDPDEAENYAKDRQRLTGVPMVTGYEALERHRGVRRPRRKLSRREKRAWKKAQKYELKLHKTHEKEEKKLAKQAAKQAAREEKAAQKQAKKEEKHKKKTKPPGSVKSSEEKGAAKKISSTNKDNAEIIKAIRSMKMDSRKMLTFLDGIQNGTVTMQFDEEGNLSMDSSETGIKKEENMDSEMLTGLIEEREDLEDEE